MQYNTQRKKLPIPEYGRNIQQMVDYCKTIKDSKIRNLHAQYIIHLMGTMNPHLRDIPDFQHKLWDQLYIMANFDLNVEFPYPLIQREEIYKKPKRLEYPQEQYSHKYYGKNIRKMIKKAAEWKDKETKEMLLQALANQMKKSYLNYNQHQVGDEVIFQHVEEISEGKIKANEIKFSLIPTSSINLHSNIFNKNKRSNKKKVKKLFINLK